MEFTIKAGSPEKLKSGCVVAGVFAGGELSAAAKTLDKASSGALATILARGDLDDKAGATLMLHGVPGIEAPRVLLVSLGAASELTDKRYRDAVAAAARQLAASMAGDAAFCLAEADVPGRDLAWRIAQAAQILQDSTYRCDELKSRKEDSKKGVVHVAFITRAKHGDELQAALRRGEAIAEGLALAKTLGNLPGNVCTPGYLATTAKKLAKEHKIKVEILDRDAMEKLGMGALLSVARGSHEAPRFIILQYKGGKAKDKPVVLVGKGITFDTGGISLKPGEGMDEMKYDMCGAASVLGTFKAIARMELPLNVIGLIPSTENMPGGSATKPGDIVTSMSGQTIEVLNTDAEGRLILCDALTYAERYEPAAVVDIATLTGACIIALGNLTSGLLANDDALAAELLAAGQSAGDKAWQLPLWDEYQDMLKSNFADIPNIGSKGAGTITAACFLARFTKAYTWAHLDIAGTAWKSGADKGATGRPVPLLVEFLARRAGA
ncbi:MAG TPA: leucyl aminopeptidase [Rhodocyclaceae bacterium]|uniref:leucyl aminopeptidase n=2 Tax=Zoogloea sp. TaxID=49181 RepID=UPI002BC54821|nr:leucyl aminopeptidase [Zoogloea sp.]HMV16449.1 leucyl aminopeptidase [Rhodocyclaceae bacterium]HMV62939.1 leucyl aminopeptidase [Rhodocyclaceae bacterium]HMW52591.1 leucyl aminopeptidase [Rhodocyclaceae bacterium]HMY48306.1 leucyl aminopeptidase [Rhodocyclaceae bacterium]HNA66401.1 leucyl aminopeptidase [Rhodocyclaceae bacterium]